MVDVRGSLPYSTNYSAAAVHYVTVGQAQGLIGIVDGGAYGRYIHVGVLPHSGQQNAVASSLYLCFSPLTSAAPVCCLRLINSLCITVIYA
jgi:hypothetical protein